MAIAFHSRFLLRITSWAIVFLSSQILGAQTENANRPPNIILILADDLGYGDLSCYGQRKFQTPRIDALAARGLRFTQHYSGSSVCAPSRCALMTGKSVGFAAIRGNTGLPGTPEMALPSAEITIAEMLKKEGYATGAFGKWGMGSHASEGSPLKQGFDLFFGYDSQFAAHNHYPTELWEGGRAIRIPENRNRQRKVYAPELIHRKALDFIESKKDGPFFCFFSTTLPHAELIAPAEAMAPFKGAFPPEIPYKGEFSAAGMKVGLYAAQPEPHAAYAAMIAILDRQVGEIVDKVAALGLESRTYIFFASDNGPHDEGGGDPRYFNSAGGLRGLKRDLFEGGLRTPLIVAGPGLSNLGETTGHISASWDLLPTIATLTGAVVPPRTNGLSFEPLLSGIKKQPQHDVLFWELHEDGGKMALRMGNWKMVRQNLNTHPNNPALLFDLSLDPQETTNLASAHPDVVTEMLEAMDLNRSRSPLFPFAFETKPAIAPTSLLPDLVGIVLMLVLIGSVLRWFRQPYVVAYLLGGIALGPSGFGFFSDIVFLNQLGDFGLIFLLFFVGMELSMSDLISRWKITVLGVVVQAALSVAVVIFIGSVIDWPLSRCVLLGFVICISSTAIVFKILQDWNALDSPVGKCVAGITIAQDIAVIPMILILQLFAESDRSEGASIWLRLLGGVIFVVIIFWSAVGRSIRLPFGERIRKDHEMQVFVALGICFGFSALSATLGLSTAMGAFVGGIFIASARETVWVKTNLDSFRVVFLSLFFMSIGAMIDLKFVSENWIYIAMLALTVLVVNTGINYGTLRLLGRSSRESWLAAAMLAQIGEFAFALAALGFTDGLIAGFGYRLAIAVIAVTLLVSPAWISLIRRLAKIQDLSKL